MIPTREEIGRAIGAAWRLFLNDPRGMAGFDLSVNGFWRSFGAIVPMAPFYFVAFMVERQLRLADPEQEAFSNTLFFAVKVAAAAVDWVAFPILLALFARQLGIARSYPAFIVARNWASLLIIIPDSAVAAAFGLGFLGGEIAGFVSLALLIIFLRYRFLIARIALGASIIFALGITLADLLLSLVITAGLNRLFLD
jgi:hypothetical protein